MQTINCFRINKPSPEKEKIMNIIAVSMSAASFMAVMGTWGVYLGKIPGGRVPERPSGSVFLQCVGIGLAFSAIVWSYQSTGSAGAAVITPAAVALMMGPAFLWLLSQRKTPLGDLKVKVCDQLLPFAAVTSEGVGFHTDELAGKRILLKFFRGGW
ncbi:MAG: hypothetical protein HN945_12930 [Deltaproteobacteria bacterium]|jgi:hypothetical protein|nr:hypothetical protein [Deltaproteobacteria bacterium]MBT7153338.1 hypothetical protein [Deltaproteobacteria bacterium]MBT7711554.1 hypothetical protein [Deltaproteobacteria bacterium]